MKPQRRSWISLLALSLLFASGCGGASSDEGLPVSTLAGGAVSGALDGPRATATFNNPVNVALGDSGSFFVADFDNGRIRRVSEDGAVTTVVNQPGFVRPFGLARFGGLLYIQTDADSAGTISPTAGAVWRYDLGTGALTLVAENLGRPRGLVVLSTGSIVMANLTTHVLELLNPATGVVTPLAGQSGVTGSANGTGAAAQFNRPYGMAVQADGSILVADSANHLIRRVTRAGEVTTFAGTGAQGGADGTRTTATFNSPQDVSIGPGGSIFVADTGGRKIRKIVGNTVTTVAGSGIRGYRDGDALTAQFWGLEGLEAYSDGSLLVADGTGGDDGTPYHRVRFVRPN